MATMITTISSSLPVVGNIYKQVQTMNIHSRPLRMKNFSYQYKSSFLICQQRPVSLRNAVMFWKLYATMDSDSTPPIQPSNDKPTNLPAWIRCIVGMIVSLVQPFWKLGAGAKFLAIGRQIEDAVEKIEDVAEIVEDVAEAVEKASTELIKKLPDDGFLKDAVTQIGNISKDIAHDAEDAIELIDKVEKVKDELESIVEDVIEGKCDPKEGMLALAEVKDQQEVMKVEATIEVKYEEGTKGVNQIGIDESSLAGQASTTPN